MSEKVNKEFWLGQLFTLLATVVGVYLAANSGFEKAIEFENLQHQRDVYHVQQSLLGEMQVNVERLQSWVDEFDKAPQNNSMSMQSDKYQLDTFFWDAAQEGSAIFEMPHQYVSGISDFYQRAEYLRSRLLSGNPFEAPKASEKLRQLTTDTRTQLLKNIQQHVTEQQQQLQKTGLI